MMEAPIMAAVKPSRASAAPGSPVMERWEGQQAPNQQEYARVDDNVSARHDRVVHYRLKDGLAVVDVSGCDPGCDQRRKSR
ncbi:MAG: hypothetical protein QGD88_10595 [Anaerolineae bacterium]|nr:hypothetical protein [Anaerolineae bacterium]